MNMKLKGYTKGSLETRVAGADPYQLVQMLMAGVLENLNYAKGAIQRKDLEKKSHHLSKAQAIVDSLRYSLDDTAGAEATGNLRELFRSAIHVHEHAYCGCIHRHGHRGYRRSRTLND